MSENTAHDVVITLDGVRKEFGDFVAVQDADFTIRRGEFFSLLGPSGCGKTTAINFLSQEQQRGIIRLDNLFDFFTKRGSPLADEAAAFLAQREQDLKVA